MNKLFLLFISFCAFSSQANELFEGKYSEQTYLISGKKITFLKYGEDILISQNCLKKNVLKCKASVATKGIYPQTVTPQERSGGRQASMIICAELNQGTPIIGRPLDSKAETSFCKFNDNSYLSSSAYNRAMVLNAKQKGIYNYHYNKKNNSILKRLKQLKK